MPKRPLKKPTIDALKRHFKIPKWKWDKIKSVCEQHGTSIGELPAWLLGKPPSYVGRWLKENKKP
jgi:hypothetical protein